MGWRSFQWQEVLELAEPWLRTCGYWSKVLTDHLIFRGWVNATLSLTSWDQLQTSFGVPCSYLGTMAETLACLPSSDLENRNVLFSQASPKDRRLLEGRGWCHYNVGTQ